MDDIAKDLLDPRVWITFVVGIIGSLFAGFLQAWVTRLWAKYSERYRHRKTRWLMLQEWHLDMLVSNAAVRTAHNFQTVTRLIIFMMMFLTLVSVTIVAALSSVGESPYSRADTNVWHILIRICLLALAFTCGVLGYKSAFDIAMATRAYRALVKRHTTKLSDLIDEER